MSSQKPKNFRPKLQQPKAAADVLQNLLKRQHLEKKLAEYEAFPHWEEIVGAELSKVCVPERIIRGKILVAKVIDSVWAQELSMRKTQFIDKIFELGIGAYIEDIRFEVSNPKEFR